MYTGFEDYFILFMLSITKIVNSQNSQSCFCKLVEKLDDSCEGEFSSVYVPGQECGTQSRLSRAHR